MPFLTDEELQLVRTRFLLRAFHHGEVSGFTIVKTGDIIPSATFQRTDDLHLAQALHPGCVWHVERAENNTIRRLHIVVAVEFDVHAPQHMLQLEHTIVCRSLETWWPALYRMAEIPYNNLTDPEVIAARDRIREGVQLQYVCTLYCRRLRRGQSPDHPLLLRDVPAPYHVDANGEGATKNVALGQEFHPELNTPLFPLEALYGFRIVLSGKSIVLSDTREPVIERLRALADFGDEFVGPESIWHLQKGSGEDEVRVHALMICKQGLSLQMADQNNMSELECVPIDDRLSFLWPFLYPQDVEEYPVNEFKLGYVLNDYSFVRDVRCNVFCEDCWLYRRNEVDERGPLVSPVYTRTQPSFDPLAFLSPSVENEEESDSECLAGTRRTREERDFTGALAEKIHEMGLNHLQSLKSLFAATLYPTKNEGARHFDCCFDTCDGYDGALPNWTPFNKLSWCKNGHPVCIKCHAAWPQKCCLCRSESFSRTCGLFNNFTVRIPPFYTNETDFWCENKDGWIETKVCGIENILHTRARAKCKCYQFTGTLNDWYTHSQHCPAMASLAFSAVQEAGKEHREELEEVTKRLRVELRDTHARVANLEAELLIQH